MSYTPYLIFLYNPTWYSSLITLEEALLASNLTAWTPLLETYSEKLISWLDIPRHQEVTDILHSAFGYKAICTIGGLEETVDLDAYSTFNIGGVIQTRTPEYYLGVSLEEGVARFNQDLETIPTIVENITTLLFGMAQTVKQYTTHAMFSDMIQVSPAPTKQEQTEYFFTTKHFKEVYLYLNVSPLILPNSVT
jgi:hypothetical protein